MVLELTRVQSGMVALLGVPYDEQSSFLRGSAHGLADVREALFSDERNLSAENGIDLGTHPDWVDVGDLQMARGLAAIEQIEEAITSLLERGARTVSLGGDHAITYPIMRAYGKHYKALNVLHLDAHPDLYDEFGGNRYSHACPFARIMEEKLAGRLVQVGIRTMNPHQREQAKRFGVEVIDMRRWAVETLPEFNGPVYLSLDMDVLDPGSAPGTSHREPGGMSTRDVISIIQNVGTPIVGADIVEYNPKRDKTGVTAVVAAKLLKEITACMLECCGS